MKNTRKLERTLKQTATKCETDYSDLTKLDPVALDTASGTGWDLEIRGQVTPKEITAMVASKVHPRFLVQMLDRTAIIVQV